MRLPWGKFKGEFIADVPSSYLLWLIENASDLRPLLSAAIHNELASRFSRPCPACARRASEPPPRPAINAELVSRWARQLALQFHPDRGGSDQAMAAINRGKEILLAMIAEGGGR